MDELLAVEESGHGEPLVLIHGLAAVRQVWGAVVPPLGLTRRVITLDVPGFGESPPAGAGFDLETVAGQIERGLAARGVERPFDLVGHSLGAAVALALAAWSRRSVKRLILVAPAGLSPLPPLASLALSGVGAQLLALRRRLAPFAELPWGRRLMLGLAVADAARLTPAQARFLIGSSAGARRTSSALATITSSDLRPLLRRTAAPLGLIWGAEDRTVAPRVAEKISAIRPDARLVTIRQAGHVVMVERPDAFVAALEGLLSTLPVESKTGGPRERERPS